MANLLRFLVLNRLRLDTRLKDGALVHLPRARHGLPEEHTLETSLTLYTRYGKLIHTQSNIMPMADQELQAIRPKLITKPLFCLAPNQQEPIITSKDGQRHRLRPALNILLEEVIQITKLQLCMLYGVSLMLSLELQISRYVE